MAEVTVKSEPSQISVDLCFILEKGNLNKEDEFFTNTITSILL